MPTEEEDERRPLLKSKSSVAAQEEWLRLQRFNWVVDARSFEYYPEALSWARLTQALLTVLVAGSAFLFIWYYVLGIVKIERQYYRYDSIPVPSMMICPDMATPKDSFSHFELLGSTIGKYPSQRNLRREANLTLVDCVGKVQCKCVSFGGLRFQKYPSSIEYASVRFQASAASEAFLFGFLEEVSETTDEVPHTFSYGVLGRKALGYLSLHLIAENDRLTNFTLRKLFRGVKDVQLYDWHMSGMSVPSEDGITELVFAFRSFQVPRDQSFAQLWSPVALMTLGAVCLSALNNLNLFGLIFPVKEHPIFSQREPASWLQAFGCCCSCVRARPPRKRPRTRLEELLQEHVEQQEEDAMQQCCKADPEEEPV